MNLSKILKGTPDGRLDQIRNNQTTKVVIEVDRIRDDGNLE